MDWVVRVTVRFASPIPREAAQQVMTAVSSAAGPDRRTTVAIGPTEVTVQLGSTGATIDEAVADATPVVLAGLERAGTTGDVAHVEAFRPADLEEFLQRPPGRPFSG